MIVLPHTERMAEISRKIIWFEDPEEALSNPVRFIAYAMTRASFEDMDYIKQYLTEDEFRDAIKCAPSGIIDGRSWAYWNVHIGNYPTPPMPVRTFD